MGLVEQTGRLVSKQTIQGHNGLPEEEVVQLIADQINDILIKNNLQESDLLGIGVGVAGHINYRKGMVITTSNLKGFTNYPVRQRLQQHFSIPVAVDNDANTQTYGTYMFGAGKGYNDMIFMTLSTGIGIGIIIDKKLYRGQTGTAGELGHTIVNTESGLRCTCGNYGCLMAHASGLALPNVYEMKVKNGIESIYATDASFDYQLITGEFLARGLSEGDPASRAVIMEIAHYAGIGLYNIFQVFNPPLILLGGGLLSLGDIYFDEIKRTFYSLVKEMLYDPVNIEISHLGPDSGILGAAALILESS